MDARIIVSKSLRGKESHCFLSPHQEVIGMKALTKIKYICLVGMQQSAIPELIAYRVWAFSSQPWKSIAITSIPEMTSQTDCHRSLLRRTLCLPCLYRLTQWLNRCIPSETFKLILIFEDYFIDRATQVNFVVMMAHFHFQPISANPKNIVCEAMALFSGIFLI